MDSSGLHRELTELADGKKAASLSRFFKTGKGEYGEGDKFMGITVPRIRSVVKKYSDMTLAQLEEPVKSQFHEERLAAFLILVAKYKKTGVAERKEIFKFYLSHRKYINNWDLIDLTAGHIVGAYLADKDRKILTELAKSRVLWDRRIAIISTFYFTYQGYPNETLRIARILINDKADLIQKAVGWMLREVGKRCGEGIEREFLDKYYRVMPRTMLRYSIERFDEKLRQRYLKLWIN
jgi:3-methyladenine DNA glycosylase AlkD